MALFLASRVIKKKALDSLTKEKMRMRTKIALGGYSYLIVLSYLQYFSFVETSLSKFIYTFIIIDGVDLLAFHTL